jgi:hypothetical protein
MITVVCSLFRLCVRAIGRVFIAVINPPRGAIRSANLGCAVAVGRISRLGGSVWALWIAGLWLELSLSIGRHLPCSRYSALLGKGLLLGPVSSTVAACS